MTCTACTVCTACTAEREIKYKSERKFWEEQQKEVAARLVLLSAELEAYRGASRAPQLEGRIQVGARAERGGAGRGGISKESPVGGWLPRCAWLLYWWCACHPLARPRGSHRQPRLPAHRSRHRCVRLALPARLQELEARLLQSERERDSARAQLHELTLSMRTEGEFGNAGKRLRWALLGLELCST